MKKLNCFRCPWCGETYNLDLCETSKKDEGLLFCDRCGQYGKQDYRWKSRSLSAIWCFILIISLSYKEAPIGFFSLLCIIFTSVIIWFLLKVLSYKVAVFRYDKKSKEADCLETILSHSDIHWYSLHRGGIGFARFRIWNRMLFPICFVDENDIPTSQVGVVRLVKRYGLFWKGAEVFLITDFIKPEAIEEGQKFYIFNEKKRIGEGIVTYK